MHYNSAMKNILSNPELEQQMGNESKRLMQERFTNEYMIVQFRKAVDFTLNSFLRRIYTN